VGTGYHKVRLYDSEAGKRPQVRLAFVCGVLQAWWLLRAYPRQPAELVAGRSCLCRVAGNQMSRPGSALLRAFFPLGQCRWSWRGARAASHAWHWSLKVDLRASSLVSLCRQPVTLQHPSAAAGALSSLAPAQLSLSGSSKPCPPIPCPAGQRCWVGNGLGQIEVLDVAAARFVGSVKGLAGGWAPALPAVDCAVSPVACRGVLLLMVSVLMQPSTCRAVPCPHFCLQALCAPWR
jgi:hypothetical protein